MLDEELEPSLRHKTGHLEFERTSQVVIFADKGLERVVATVSKGKIFAETDHARFITDAHWNDDQGVLAHDECAGDKDQAYVLANEVVHADTEV